MKNLKKKNITILISENEEIIQEINNSLKENILLINEKINFIEKLKNTIIFPVNKQNTKHIENMLIKNILKTKNLKIKSIILDTKIPNEINQIENININKIKTIFYENILVTLKIIKDFFYEIKYDDLKIIILLHYVKKKSKFFIQNTMINEDIKELTKMLKNNNDKIKINILSTENVALDIKKKIYPYKNNKKLKNKNEIIKSIKKISQNKINNKIIII